MEEEVGSGSRQSAACPDTLGNVSEPRMVTYPNRLGNRSDGVR